MHELQVTPLLLHRNTASSSQQRRQRRLQRASQSFDCGESSEEYSNARLFRPAVARQRSNPNILDLIPPPPVYAPPSLPPGPAHHHPPPYHHQPAHSRRHHSRKGSSLKAKQQEQHISERRGSGDGDSHQVTRLGHCQV